LISLDEFSAWQETLYLLSNPANAERLLKSIQEAKAGRVIERALIEE
jgi:antitoxin YefM